MKATVTPTSSSAALIKPRLCVRTHTLFFALGDFLFLITVGVVSTLVMQRIHQLAAWNFAVTFVVGMAAAMVAQMLMAFCAAPLLGSIETMIPSMSIGMVSPMTICTLHLIGHETGLLTAVVVGATFGGAMFAFVQIYGGQVQRIINQSPSNNRGA